MQSLLREKYLFQFLYMIVVNLWSLAKYDQGSFFNADVCNSVKYTQMSCPTRKCDEKNIKKTLFASAGFGDRRLESQ